jgi:N-acetylmuramoyl-L-alanine amidase
MRLTDRGERIAKLLAVVAVLGLVAVLAAVFGGSGSPHTASAVNPSTPVPTTSPVTSPTPKPGKHSGSATRHQHPSSSPAPTPSGGHPLAGLTIGIDPGHNGGNFSHPSAINRIIWNGRQHETCDTTGTETNGGYTEARFTFNVASYLAADLRRAGANIVMTRTTNNGVGPCVNRRARIIDATRAAAAIDIHADGGPASGRGFAILEPVPDGPNNNVIASSRRLGAVLRRAFLRTGMPTSTYDGSNGIALRNDLAGLNLTTVPKVLIECGNMRNATDAAMLTSPRFQRRAAQAMVAAVVGFTASQAR